MLWEGESQAPLAERTYCDSCGLTMDRDLNAAINICVAGSAPETLNARGEDVRRNQHTVGNADLGEARTKQAHKSAVRLGADGHKAVLQTN